MGLTESAAAPAERRDSGRSSLAFLAELNRHSFAPPPPQPKTNRASIRHDASARIAVLPDGSCAFFKGGRVDVATQVSTTDDEQDSTNTCHRPCRSEDAEDEVSLEDEAVGELTPSTDVTATFQPPDLTATNTLGSSDRPRGPRLYKTLPSQLRGSSKHDKHKQHKGGQSTMSNDNSHDNWSSATIVSTELRSRIEVYNQNVSESFGIQANGEGQTYQGFVRIHMNLNRPISVVAGCRPPSIYDILKEEDTTHRTLTTFYLPRDTVRAIHITSETTTIELIKKLLRKFKIVDNPSKFVLYQCNECDGSSGRDTMTRIADNEKPLQLALQWVASGQDAPKRFVLQENETGDIQWDAFSFPELQNFLRILDREEDEYRRLVVYKYQVMAERIKKEMTKFQKTDPKEEDKGNSK